MNYIIGQGFGLLASLCCLIQPLWKKKWQIMVAGTGSNLFAVFNLLLLGQFGSGAVICAVGVVQGLVALWHLKADKPILRLENILFFILYVGCGLLGYKGLIDVLPIVGSMLYMLMAFQRDEQKSRWLLLGNAIVFFLYYALVGSTTVIAEVFAIITSSVALYKYRPRNN